MTENIFNKVKIKFLQIYTTLFCIVFILIDITLFGIAALNVYNGPLNNVVYMSNEFINTPISSLLLSIPSLVIFAIYVFCAIVGIVIAIIYHKKYNSSLCAFILLLFFSYILVLYYYLYLISCLYFLIGVWG